MDLGAKLEIVERLSRLREEGALTDEEFNVVKGSVLSITALSSDVVQAGGDGARDARSAENWLLAVLGAGIIGVGGFFFIASRPSTPPDALSSDDMATGPAEETGSAEEPLADASPDEETAALAPADASLGAAANSVEAQSSAGYGDTLATSTNMRPATEVSGSGSRPLEPIANLESYVGSEDYPQSAMELGEQGSVSFKLTVGTNGRVSNCAIISTSGSRSLDSATCRVLTARARFRPALDTNGIAIEATTSSSIGWRLAG